MKIINKVNNVSIMSNLTINETTDSIPYYNQYGNIQYDSMGTQIYENINISEFVLNDNNVDLTIDFLGSRLDICIKSAEQMAFLNLLTNIEVFGEKWWNTYKKYNQDIFLSTLTNDFIVYVDKHIKVYFRDKNIDEVLND
jgi:hypothetical protein